MNILILSWRGPKHPNAGGAEISTHEHAKGWVKAGHDVTLFTSAFVGYREKEVIDGVKIKRCGRQMFGVQWEAFKWYLLGKHPKFDLVIDQFHGIPFFTPLYVRIKKLGFIHETAKEVWRLNSWRAPLNLLPAIFGTFLEPFIFRLLYINVPFMTVSDSTKEDLVEWGIPQKQITVIFNGLSIPKTIKVFKNEEKKTLIFLGVLTKDKGIEDVLKVFGLINQTKQEEWQFWVVGKADPEYLRRLKLQSKKLGIDKWIKFWGFVSDEKKFELLSKSRIAINPSVREGWGLVVIEAASAGTPTVAFNVPGLRDSIINNETGIICSENTVENLARATLMLINDAKKYKRMSRNAVIWSKKFSWKKSAKISLMLINNLVKV